MMFPAPALPESSRLDGAAMECAGGHPFLSGFLVTPGLSLMGETN